MAQPLPAGSMIVWSMMDLPNDDLTLQWAENWLNGVADGTYTMRQRKLSSVEKRGGLEAVKTLAEERGVHLLLLEDDKGDTLLAASVKPFQVVC